MEGKQSNQISTPRKYLILTVCFFEVLLFGGITGGWNVFVYVLKRDGVYSHVCDNKQGLYISQGYYPQSSNGNIDYFNATSQDCDAQDSHFSLAFTLSQVVVGLLCFPLGGLFDRFGLMICRLLNSFMAITVFLCYGFADGNLSWLIYPGAILMPVASASILICAYHACHLLGDKVSTGMAVFTGATTTSASVMLLVKLAADAGYGREYSLSVLIGLQVISTICTLFLMPRYRVPVQITQPAEKIDEESSDSACNTEKIAVGVEDKTSEKINIMLVEYEKSTFRQNLCTLLYLSHVIWFAVARMRVTYFVGVFNAWVNSVVNGDKSKVSLLSNIYGYAITSGIIIAPIVGILIDRMRKYIKKKGLVGREKTIVTLPALVLAMILTVALSLCTLGQTEGAVIAAIVLAAITNSIVYPANSTYFQIGFPAMHFGKLYGLGYMVSALFNFLQFGFFTWSTTSDDFFTPSLVVLIMVLITCLHGVNIYAHHWVLMRNKKKMKLAEGIEFSGMERNPYVYDHEVTHM